MRLSVRACALLDARPRTVRQNEGGWVETATYHTSFARTYKNVERHFVQVRSLIALQRNTIKREQPAGQGQVARLLDENVRSKL